MSVYLPAWQPYYYQYMIIMWWRTINTYKQTICKQGPSIFQLDVYCWICLLFTHSLVELSKSKIKGWKPILHLTFLIILFRGVELHSLSTQLKLVPMMARYGKRFVSLWCIWYKRSHEVNDMDMGGAGCHSLVCFVVYYTIQIYRTLERFQTR